MKKYKALHKVGAVVDIKAEVIGIYNDHIELHVHESKGYGTILHVNYAEAVKHGLAEEVYEPEVGDSHGNTVIEREIVAIIDDVVYYRYRVVGFGHCESVSRWQADSCEKEEWVNLSTQI